MKTAIVMMSDIRKSTGCMLPQRFLDLCYECDRVERCPNEEAIAGRMRKLLLQKEAQLKVLERIQEKIDGLDTTGK